MTVRDTISTSLKEAGLGSYERQAEPVIAALETREAEIVENLTSFAVENGLTHDQARRALADCGLTVPMTAVTGEDPRIAAMERAMTEMQQTLREMRGE
jgi:hypothetical protein